MLELGGSGLFSYIIQDLNPSVHIDSTTTDLRYKLDLNSQSYDFLLNMEVIEHIKDQNSNSIGEMGCFTKSGLNTFLSECYRLLKPNGLMFLTTPNLTSLDNIHRILHHLPPINYYPHFREYSIGELKEFAENHKFAVLKIDTFDIAGTSINRNLEVKSCHCCFSKWLLDRTPGKKIFLCFGKRS